MNASYGNSDSRKYLNTYRIQRDACLLFFFLFLFAFFFTLEWVTLGKEAFIIFVGYSFGYTSPLSLVSSLAIRVDE